MKKEFETPVLRRRVFTNEILLTESTKNSLNKWLAENSVKVEIAQPKKQ